MQTTLLTQYFGNIVNEARIEVDSIGNYSLDLPLRIEAEYRAFLEEVWCKHTIQGRKGQPLVLEEEELRLQKLRENLKKIEPAYKAAMEVTLWEKITDTNYKDIAHYKEQLYYMTADLLQVMRKDFLEEITGKYIQH